MTSRLTAGSSSQERRPNRTIFCSRGVRTELMAASYSPADLSLAEVILLIVGMRIDGVVGSFARLCEEI